MSAKKRRSGNRPAPVGEARQTKQERRDEIKQARVEAQKRRLRARRRRLIMTWGLVVLIALLGAGFGITRFIESRRTVQSALKEAGCSKIQEFEAQPAVHFDAADAPPRNPYNTDPPTSGDHTGSGTAPWGSQQDTVEPELYVHNLEHGGIVIHYKNLGDTQVDALSKLADSYSDGVIAMPNDSVKSNVVITSWAHMQTCKTYSEKVVKAFVSDRCNKGPEKITSCKQ